MPGDRLNKKARKGFFVVEMAGIEPASERLDRQMSTSVVKVYVLLITSSFTSLLSASCLSPKALFPGGSSVNRGTPTL